jgi:hypothetical protein
VHRQRPDLLHRPGLLHPPFPVHLVLALHRDLLREVVRLREQLREPRQALHRELVSSALRPALWRLRLPRTQRPEFYSS